MNEEKSISEETIVKSKKQKVGPCSYLNVRIRPDVESSILAVLKKNTPVIIKETLDEGWLKISTTKGLEGFVKESHITNE